MDGWLPCRGINHAGMLLSLLSLQWQCFPLFQPLRTPAVAVDSEFIRFSADFGNSQWKHEWPLVPLLILAASLVGGISVQLEYSVSRLLSKQQKLQVLNVPLN
jgi:hypothetical protein